jgi:hypothetical protein
MIDDSRTGLSIPHPSTDVAGGGAASAAAPLAVSFARQVEAAGSFGAGSAGGGDASGGFSGAARSGGRGGGNGSSSAIASTDAAALNAKPTSANTKQRALEIEGAVIKTPG